MAITQKHRIFGVNTVLGEDVLVFHRMVGSEQIGQLFEYNLELLSEKTDIQSARLLGTNMTVRMQLPESRKAGIRYFNGFVTRFSYLGMRGMRYGVYGVTLSPWLWFLTRTSNCRIFQGQNVPNIIKTLFAQYDVADFKTALNGQYRDWEYCVQYRETDFNFISRLMEQEGIYYYFKHDHGRHTLILADNYSSHSAFPEYAQVPYYPPDQMEYRERDHLYQWIVENQVQSGAYALNDYDFKVPRKNLHAVSLMPKPHKQADFEVYDYPGKYFDLDEGNHYCRVRLEELLAQHEVFLGQGIARGLATGYLFALINSGRQDMNREYLIITAHYELQSDFYESTPNPEQAGKPYQIHITAINSQHSFRAPRITPKPTVHGPQTAIVVGKDGEEIWTDQWGRVKVQFHWDRYAKRDENSSCWIRVAQVWAGKGWGGVAIPRIGQEVIVDFLEGDPDQPIITGRVYNGASMPPYGLPSGAVISGVKSNSTKGGGGYNEYIFDDTKSNELIREHGQHDKDSTIEHDLREHVLNNRSRDVTVDETVSIGNNRSKSVGKNETTSIGVNRTETVGSNESIAIGVSRTTHIGVNDMLNIGVAQEITIGGLQALTVGATRSVSVGASQDVSIGADLSDDIGSNHTTKIAKNQSSNVGENRSAQIGKDDALKVGKNLVIDAGDSVTIKTGKASISMKKDGTISIEGKNITIKGSGEINVKASKNITMKGNKILEN